MESGSGFDIINNISVVSNASVYFMHGYPSGFTLIEVISICVLVIVVMAVIIVGNLLVIISIFSEAALQVR